MNKNETRTLWISVGAALFAVFLLYSYTQEKSAELTNKFGAMKRVVVAKREIKEMQTIDETMLMIVEKPVDFIEPKAIEDMNIAVGQVALAPINKNEQVLESKIIEPGKATGLALQITPEKRAMTLPLDEIRGVAKLLKPGDRIDIIAAIPEGSGINKQIKVRTILQDTLILATGLKIVNDLPRLYEKLGSQEYIKNIRSDTNFSNITVEVSPINAQKLIYILATAPGSLFYTLKHPSDTQPLRPRRLPSTGVRAVLGLPPIRPTAKPRAPAAALKPAPKPKAKKKTGFVDL